MIDFKKQKRHMRDRLLAQLNANTDDWNDWHWQLANSITVMKHICAMTNCLGKEDMKVAERYPMQATPFYVSRAKEFTPADPVMQQCLPNIREFDDASTDPFCEEKASPVPRLVHRYYDRALFMSCGCCAMHCRHCMRKRVWDNVLPAPTDEELERCTNYLKQHSEVREVLISGGDPLTLEDADIKRILMAFASVPSIEMLRIGSRTLVALPQRYTEELCSIFEKTGKTIWIASHFNHPQELSEEAAAAVLLLMKHGVSVVNQSVLLKGINDNSDILKQLFTGLLKMRIKPYYLFHGDPVSGTTCFRTGIREGQRIMAELRSKVSGMALPAFAFDLPEGGGKVRLEPDLFAGNSKDGVPLFYKHDGTAIEYR